MEATMKKIAAAAFAAMVLTHTVLPGGIAQTAKTTNVMPTTTAVEESATEYDDSFPTDTMFPTPEPEVLTPSPTITATTTPTTTPAVPKEFLETDKVSYVFRELSDKEVDELAVGEKYAVHLKFNIEMFQEGEELKLGAEGMTFEDIDLQQMVLFNNLGFPIATFEDISKEAGVPMLRVKKIETHEEIVPDFGWNAQIILPVNVNADFEAAAIEKNNPIVPMIGVMDNEELKLIKPTKAREG